MLPAIILFAATYVLMIGGISNMAAIIPAYILIWILFGV